MNPIIKIIAVDELPSEEVLGWDYPMDELDHLTQQIKDGDRENNSTMLLHNKRLYEFKNDVPYMVDVKL